MCPTFILKAEITSLTDREVPILLDEPSAVGAANAGMARQRTSSKRAARRMMSFSDSYWTNAAES
jgi:hypothetical protein